MKTLVIGLILLLINSSNVFANENINKIDIQMQDCLNQNYTTAGMNECIIKTTQIWEREITNLSIQIEKTLPKKERILFQKSQKSWLKYYKTEKTLLNKTIYIKTGTIHTNIANSLVLDFAKQRALYLENYLHYISK